MAEAAVATRAGFRGLADRMPVIVFLALTYAWAWLLWGYWIPAMPPGGLQISVPFILCAIVGGFAPSLAALATVWLREGPKGVGDLLRGLMAWRTSTWLYAVTLLIVPLATVLAMAVQTTILHIPIVPDPSLIGLALVWPLMAALGEEIGWRGFLFPRLLPRLGHVGTALVIGVVWGIWHLPADFIGLKAYGEWFPLAFLLNGPLVLTAHALIMAWLWKRSGGNLLLMVLYHWTVTASAMLTPVSGSDPLVGITSAAVGVAVFWIIATTLWVAERRRA